MNKIYYQCKTVSSLTVGIIAFQMATSSDIAQVVINLHRSLFLDAIRFNHRIYTCTNMVNTTGEHVEQNLATLFRESQIIHSF